MLTRVEYVKRTPDKTFVIVDVGMNDLIRPALYGAFHRIAAVEHAGDEMERVTVVGPICESSDFNAEGIQLPKVAGGDLLAFMGAGAYVASMGSAYNARRLPPEILVEDGRYRVVRTRQTYDELFGAHVLDASQEAGR